MDGLIKDVAYAVRSLARAPGFVAVALITIALGIGANTAIFSVTRAVLLRPLPYPEPDRLVMVWSMLTNRNVRDFPHSPPDLRDIRERTTAFEGLAGALAFPQPLTGDGEPQQILVGGATYDFFDVLGVRPMIGRSFREEDGIPVTPGLQPGQAGFQNNAAILSHAFWQQRFGGDAGVLGTIVDLGGAPTEIVGVLPPDYRTHVPRHSTITGEPDAWVASRIDYDNAPRANVFLTVVGRLRAGASLDQAQQELDQVAAYLRGLNVTWETGGYALEAAPLHAELTEGVRPLIVALMGAVGFVLLVACANVSNLLLVRASRRQREIAVRGALGGSRTRIVRQLLAESLLLAGAGALLGVLLAKVGVDLLLLLTPDDLPRLESVGLDATVLGFAALAAFVAALLFGVVPAVQASRPDLAESLKDRGRSSLLASQRLLRSGVVVSEVALSLVLLVGAGLMARSFVELQSVHPGFEHEGVVTFGTNVPFQRYQDAAARSRFYDQLRERIVAIPGVSNASAAFPLPLEGLQFNGRWGLEEALEDPQAFQQADYYAVQAGFFETLRTPILEGRAITRADDADSAAVVVVNRRMAERAFPGESAVGRRILVRVSSPEPQWVEIVGVIDHQALNALSEVGREAVYFPQRFVGAFGGTWAVRTELDLASLRSAVRRELDAVDAMVPVSDIRPMSDFVREAMAATRFALVLIGVFGALALILAAVGLYGVLAYTVRQRTAEIGVRMAFGAERGRILWLVVGQGMKLALVGVGVGVVAALALSGLMARLVVGVTPTDPLTFGVVPLMFLAVAAVACAIPAARASHVDPSVALREE